MQITPGLYLKTGHAKESETTVSAIKGRIKTYRTLLLSGLLCLSSACVYEIDIQQGNKLELKDVEAVDVGMTRNQVRYLLGTPVVNNARRDDDAVKGRAVQSAGRALVVCSAR